jgi:hypothetical protein
VAALALLVPVVGHAASGPVLNFYAPGTTTPPITTFGYGPVSPGQSVSKTFPLKNTGGSATAALKITLTPSAGTPASAFTKTGDTCTQPIPISLGKGKTCEIEITFTPVAGGVSYGADLTAVSKKPNATKTLHLTGSGAAPHVVISPASKDFGSVGTDQIFTATNNGTAPSGSYAFDPPSAPFAVFNNSCSGASLGIGASCSFRVLYRPSTCGGDANYGDTAALGSLASVSLTATEPECPHLSVVSPDSWDFGTTSGTHTFTFTNDGAGPAFVKSGGFVNFSSVFTFGYQCLGATLEPGQSCSQDVSFTLPAGCGESYTGDIVYGAAPPGIWFGATITTSATATFTAAQPACAANVTISPDSWDFGTASGTKTFTVKNEGTAEATFFVGVGGSAVFADAVGSTCDGSLQPGEECGFNIDFTQVDGCGQMYLGNFTVTESATGPTTATLAAAQPDCPPSADISITVAGAASLNTCSPGWLLNVTNNGPNDAEVVIAKDFSAADGSSLTESGSWEFDGQTGSVSRWRNTIAAGETKPFGTTACSPTGVVSVEVYSSSLPDPDSTPNNGTANGEDDYAIVTGSGPS